MEDVYYIVAIVLFVLATCLLIACVVIFFRAGVPDAIRFLRHRPMKIGRGSSSQRVGSGAKGRRRVTHASGAADAAPGCSSSNPRKDGDALAMPPDKTRDIDSPASELGTARSANDYAGDSESPTGLLVEEESENPTGFLAAEDSENPTGLLVGESSENPTGLLVEKAAPAPENQQEEQRPGVVQQVETTFRFILKQDVIVVHTQETIE